MRSLWPSVRRPWRSPRALGGVLPAAALHRAASSVPPSSTLAASNGADSAAAGVKGAEKKKEETEEESTSWWDIGVRGVGGAAGLLFLYNFHQSGYSVHRTEILLLEKFRQLPLYYHQGPLARESNSELRPDGLPPEVVAAFADWFVAFDHSQPDGVTRDDVLEILRDLGYDEGEHKACKAYVQRGEGHLEERKRLEGTSLQDSVSLYAKLFPPLPTTTVLPGPQKDGAVVEDVQSEDQERLAKSQEAVALLRRRCQELNAVAEALATSGGGSVPGGAIEARLAQQAPGDLGADATMSAFDPTAAFPSGGIVSGGRGNAASSVDDAGDMDDVGSQQLEIARLSRIEAELLAKLDRFGSLSPAEELRLRAAREDKLAASATMS